VEVFEFLSFTVFVVSVFVLGCHVGYVLGIVRPIRNWHKLSPFQKSAQKLAKRERITFVDYGDEPFRVGAAGLQWMPPDSDEVCKPTEGEPK
jgi:hypothetical protein